MYLIDFPNEIIYHITSFMEPIYSEMLRLTCTDLRSALRPSELVITNPLEAIIAGKFIKGLYCIKYVDE